MASILPCTTSLGVASHHTTKSTKDNHLRGHTISTAPTSVGVTGNTTDRAPHGKTPLTLDHNIAVISPFVDGGHVLSPTGKAADTPHPLSPIPFDRTLSPGGETPPSFAPNAVDSHTIASAPASTTPPCN